MIEPSWKSLVDRWHQLDSVSYGLAEAAYRRKESHRFDFVILCSVGASNRADREFIESGFMSPAKFVYTLANVPLSALCQVLEWRGQTRCVVCRENELDIVHQEAKDLARLENKSVALFVVDQGLKDSSQQVNFFHYQGD
jgi:hypothetical protein